MTLVTNVTKKYLVYTLAGLGILLGLLQPEPLSAFTGLKKITYEKVQLAPHRAVYDMVLEKASSGSGITNVVGRMVYEFQGSDCEGYTLNMRMATNVTDKQGDALVTDMRSSTWEKGNGKRFRFYSSQYYNNNLTEETNGDARFTKAAKNLSVKLTKPKRKKIVLSDDVLFPTQHSKMLLKSARLGKKIVHSKLYDGSEKGKKLFITTAFIGNKTEGGAGHFVGSLKNSKRLNSLSSWPVAISYFQNEVSHGETLPTYELFFRLYDNGVSSDLHINYGDFSIKGKLTEIKFFTPHKCR